MGITRVTQAGLHGSALAGLQASLGRVQRLQEQLSSGRQLNRPSDSPTGTVSAMQYRSALRRAEQFARNAQDGLDWLDTADRTLTSMHDGLARARELALRGLNGSMGPIEREAMAAEVDTIRENLLALANTTYLDRPIFAGNAAVSRAYDAAGVYQGSGAPDVVERAAAPDVRVRVNLTGPEVFGPPGADVFQALADLADHLRTAPGALGGDVAVLDAHAVTIRNQLATVGARTRQLEGLRGRAEEQLLTLRAGLSEVEDVDLPKTIVELQLQEIGYQAALAATARVVQPSLLEFLR